MSIYTAHQHFRTAFSEMATANSNFTFTPGAPDTITRVAGNFITQGFLAGHALDVIGSANNDGRQADVATVAALSLTLESSGALTAEGPVACVLSAGFIDPDGNYTWPVDLVRSGTFTNGFTGIPTPYIGGGAAMVISCNSGAADSAFGVDEYDWYLSQRTDDPALQYLDIAQKPAAGGSSYSGTVQISHNSAAEDAFGFTLDVTPAVIPLLFRNCHLYCRRISDGRIQWVDLLKAQLANY